MRFVADESALPAPAEGQTFRYVRSLLDPYAYINGATGEVFARTDGAKWEHGGYKIERDVGGKVTFEIGSAYADHQRYAPSDAERAA